MMNMTNTCYFTGVVTKQPISEKSTKINGAYVELSVSFSGKETIITMPAYGAVAQKLMKVKPQQRLLINAAMKDVVVDKHSWQTRLRIDDFVELGMDKQQLLAQANQEAATLHHKRQQAIYDVIFDEFLK